MTFEQLDYFIASVESETFFDAAESMHTTHSTLSKQIQKLEQELNVDLWDRSRRRARLTPAGKSFYKEAQKLSRQYHETLKKMKTFQPVLKQELCIGTLPFLAQYHLTERIRKFRELHPKITLSLSELEENDLLSGLAQDAFELIIARETMIDTKQYSFKPVAKDTLSVILSSDHPLAKCSVLSLEDIQSERFILMHPYTSIYQLCMNLFEKASIKPTILRTARVESIISAIQIGEGISLFPESNLQLFQHDWIVAVPLINAPTLKIGLVYKKGRETSPFLSAFLDTFS